MKCQLSSCQFSGDKWQCPSLRPTILCFLTNHSLDLSAPGHCTTWKALPFLTLCSGVAHFPAQDSFIKVRKMATQIESQQTGPQGRYWPANSTQAQVKPFFQHSGCWLHHLMTGTWRAAGSTMELRAGCRSCLPRPGDPAGRTVSPTSLGPCGAGAGSDHLCAPAPSTLTYE